MTPDEEQDEWLRQQAAQASVNQPETPTPAQAAGPWARARDLMQRQSQMQYQPQQYAEVKAEAAPKDDTTWRTILAMGLNLLGNKGRDVGDLMMQGTQARNAQIADWQKRNSPDALLARQMQTKQLQNMDRQAFNDERRVLGDQINQEVAMAGAEQSQANADRAFNHQAERDIVGDTDRQLDRERQAEQFAATQALSREQLRATNANAAAARAQAARFHQDSIDEALNARRDAAAERQRQYEHDLDKQERGFAHDDAASIRDAQTKKDIYDLSHPAPVAPEGYRVKPGFDAQFRQSMGSPKIMSDILTQAGNAGQINKALDDLIYLRKADSSEANKKQYDAAIKTLIGNRSEEGSTGVLSSTEFARYIADLPEYGALNNVSTIRGARDVLLGRDPAIETLQGVKKRFNESNLAKMTPYGLEYADTPKPEEKDPYASKYGLRLVQ